MLLDDCVVAVRTTLRLPNVVRAWVNPYHLFSHQVYMSTIEPEPEVSEQVESPAEAALKIEARIHGSVATYTDEQLKAIRPSK
jgi:hypothetical protein